MSLQTGGQLAVADSAIIDPENLTILAFKLSGARLVERDSYLLTEDIREFSNLGFIVDSADEFVAANDVIRLKEVLELDFLLEGKSVKDQHNHKLGKVTEYSVEPRSFLVKQLIAKRPLIKSFTDTELVFDRTQILEVSDDVIVIKNDERQPAPVARATNTYTNPFRGQTPQPEAIDRHHPS